jgi:hypothetical protein
MSVSDTFLFFRTGERPTLSSRTSERPILSSRTSERQRAPIRDPESSSSARLYDTGPRLKAGVTKGEAGVTVHDDTGPRLEAGVTI